MRRWRWGGSGVTLSDSVESVLTPHLAPATLRGVVCIHHTNHTQGGNLNIEVGAINDVVFKRTRRDVNIHELADEVVLHLSDRGAVLMANHGLLCVGKSPEDALHTAAVVEHTAKIVAGAEQLGGVVPLPEEIVTNFTNIYGLIRGGWTPPHLAEVS